MWVEVAEREGEELGVPEISSAETQRQPGHAGKEGPQLARCARPSGVPRGPANFTGSLASQGHPGKFPKVPGRWFFQWSCMDVRVGL